MATTPTKPHTEMADPLSAISVPGWTKDSSSATTSYADERSAPQNALQTLLAFSALHEQVRRRKALAAKHPAFDSQAPVAEFEPEEQFVLDEVLQLVAERAVSITGADGLAIALAENNEIVLRAAAGTIRPDVGARIDRDSAFSGAAFRTAQVVNCDDTETDSRVNLQACRKLGARSMVAVPLCGRRRVIGLLEAFSSWPFGFNDSDVRNLTLLAELVLAALKPEDEDRFASSAQVAVKKLEPSKPAAAIPAPTIPLAPPVASVASAPLKAQPVAPPPAPAVPVAKPALVQAPTAWPTTAQPSSPQPSVAPAASAKPATAAAPAPKLEEKPAAKPDPKSEPKADAKPELKSDAKPDAKLAAPVMAPAPVVAEAVKVASPEAAAKLTTSEAVAKLAAAEVETKADAAEAAAAPTEQAPETNLPLGQAEPASNYRWIPIVLIFVVITTAFAAGVWWKLKSAQLGSEIVHNEPAASASPSHKSASTSSNPAAPNAATATNNQASDQDDSNSSPAAPQELSKFPHVTGVRHWSSPDSSTVVLDLEDQIQYEPHRLTSPDRVYFDLHNTQLAADLTNKAIDIGDAFITRIRMAQPVAGMTRVVLEIKPNTNFSVSLEPNPYRLTVEVSKVGTTPKGAVNLFPDAEAEKKVAVVIPPPTKEDLQLKARVPKMRIVVDAGHGGWDLGTVGRRGLLEKDLVLEIAERLGKLLESRLGSEVIYTRQDDTYIPLDERAEIANQSQADLFVSVHANYSDLVSARGVETYYTNTFSAPGSKGAGTKDADAHSVAGSLQNAVAPTLSTADLHERIEMSRRLAASVQRSLYGTLSIQNPGLRDRGIKEAGFVVLTESAMPGILAEVSFVSSPTDEQKLRSDGYREQIAEALYRGIARYAVASKGVKLASAAK